MLKELLAARRRLRVIFLGPGEQRFQLFAPEYDAGEIVFDFGGGDPILDRPDDVLALFG